LTLKPKAGSAGVGEEVGSAGGGRALSTGADGASSGGGDRGGPKRSVLIAGIAGTTLALGAGFAFLGAATTVTSTETWRTLGYAGIWSLAGAGGIGLATGAYALWGSGSTEKMEAKGTVRVSVHPGGVVVTGAF
jgi:hypothetical protein